MNEPVTNHGTSTNKALRARAEKLLRTSRANVSGMPPEDIHALVHELQVHQIELELQNEELRNAQHELAISLDRYSDLYQFSPVGYLSIDADGKTFEANLTAANVLGVERHELIGRKLSDFVARESQDKLYLHLQSVRTDAGRASCELSMTRPGDRPCIVRLDSIAAEKVSGKHHYCRISMVDITDQKEAEEWTIEAKRLRLMVENLPAGAVFVDHELVELNRTAEKITGYSRDEIHSLDDWYEKLFGEGGSQVRGLHTKDHQAGFPNQTTITIRRKDGRHREVEFAGHAFDHHEVWLLHDVTEQQLAAQQLRLQERAIQAARDAILITDATQPDNPVIFCNDAMQTMTGYTREEFVGRNCRFLQGDDRDQAAIAEVRNAIASGSPCHVVLRNYRKDGTLFWNELSLSPIHDEDGQLTHFVSIQNDLTDRKSIEADLAIVNAKLESFVNSVPDALIVVNANREIDFCNPGIERVFGYEPDELIGKSTLVLYADPDEFARQGKLKFTADATQAYRPQEIMFRHKNGMVFTGEMSGTIFRDAKAKPLGFLGLVRDVSERNRLHAEQRRYQEVLEAFSKGTSLDALLKLIVRQMEEIKPGTLCSILLLDDTGECLHGKYSSSIPVPFQQAIDGLRIGPDVSSCGTAALTGMRVIAEQIETHPNWEACRELAAQAGLRACWSEPILSPDRGVLGTLAMYFREPKSPDELDLRLMKHSAAIAAIAIDRSRANERIRKSEERYRSLVSASYATIWITTPDGRFDFPQPAWEEYTGQPWSDHQGKGWLSMIHADDQASILVAWNKAVQSGTFYKSRGRVWHAATKQYRHFEAQAVPIHDQDGRVVEWVGSTTDVHDRIEAQQQLQKSEHEFHTLADNVPEQFAYIDTDQRFRFVNRSYQTVHQRPQSEIIGKHVREITGDDAYESSIRKHLETALSGQSVSYQAEVPLPPPRDGMRWIHATYLPDIDAGKVRGIFALVSDITEQRVLQKQVLDIAAEENRRFAQDLHDGISQELAGMGMIAHALVTALSRHDAPEADIAMRLKDATQRTLHQVRELAHGINPVDVDGQGLYVAISEMSERLRELYGIDCALECPHPVSLRDNQVATQLYRIAQEATTNAIKHGKPTRIKISLIVDDGDPRLEIFDNGNGISDVDAQTTGMGLRTMRYRADVIGGQLSLEGLEEGGTRVTCTFPAEVISRSLAKSE